MKNRTKFIVCDSSKCVGCEICMQACSASKEKTFNPLYSRIHTVHLNIAGEPVYNMSIACHHCDDPACVKVCPREALSVDEQSGIIVVNTDFEAPHSCHVPCGWCWTTCEFGALIYNPKLSMSAVCDLCPNDRVDEETPCVRACPKDALSLATIDEMMEKTESNAAKNLLSEMEKAREDSKSFYEKFGYMPLPPTRGVMKDYKARGSGKTLHNQKPQTSK